MPAAIQYYEDMTTPDAKKLEEAYEAELRARCDRHKMNWAYYYGNHRAPLKNDRTGTDDNLIVNLMEGIVDKSVSTLIGVEDNGLLTGVELDIADEPGEAGFVQKAGQALRRVFGQQPEEPADTANQDYLDAVCKANKWTLLLLDTFMNGAVCGHAFWKLLPDEVMSDDGYSLPRIVNLNPDHVTAFWHTMDMDNVLWYRIQAGESGYRVRQDIVKLMSEDGNATGEWAIYDYTETRAGLWQLKQEPQTWPYGWPPVIDWKNLPNPNSYYGRDDIEGKGKLNDGLNLTISNIQRILKHHAHPKTVVTGARVADIVETEVGGLFSITSDAAKVYNLEMQSDLTSSLNFAMLLWRAIFDLARELNPGTVADKLGAITNFGLRVLFADSLAKSGMKRMLATEALTRTAHHLLEMGGGDPTVTVNVIWPDPLPSDPLATAQALQIMTTLGLSQDTALERAGYDPEQEAQKRERDQFEQAAVSRANSGAQLVQQLMAGRMQPPQGQPPQLQDNQGQGQGVNNEQ